jgi:molecular chaperone DnaK (HSP70)
LIVESINSAEKDQQTKELILQRNKLDSLIKNTRKALHEFGGSVSSEQSEAISGILLQAEENLKGDNLAELHTVYCNVELAASDLTESLMAAV